MNTELSQMELVFPQKGGLHCCSMVADEDGVLYFSYYNGAGNDLYRLRYDPAAGHLSCPPVGQLRRGQTTLPA